MTLPPAQFQLFFRMMRPLLRFSNQQLNLFPDLQGNAGPDGFDKDRAIKARDALWENDLILNQFIQQNPAGLAQADLDTLKSWKYRRTGNFFIYKVLKKHGIFINQEGKQEVFEVKGLQNAFDELLPFFPILVRTVLLPFEGEIVVDGLFTSHGISYLVGSPLQSRLQAVHTSSPSPFSIEWRREEKVYSSLEAPLLHSMEKGLGDEVLQSL